MVLISLTASHHELDLESLEQLTSGADSLGEAIVRDCNVVTGAVVLSTCNRLELYLEVSDQNIIKYGEWVKHSFERTAELIARHSNVEVEKAKQSFTVRQGYEVAQHLFTVASGIDSMVIGEREIAGQVRRSLEQARTKKTTTAKLERLFQKASQTSKKVAYQTQLGADGRSIVSVALGLAEKHIPPWGQSKALIIGSGAYAGASAVALRNRGCRDITVYSPSGRGKKFATQRSLQLASDLVTAISESDVVISCSGTSGPGLHYILQRAAISQARQSLAENLDAALTQIYPLVILDLALHRDADPAIADIDQVMLLDLATVRANLPHVSCEPITLAQEIVHHAVREYADNETMRTADTVIIEIRNRIQFELQIELHRSQKLFRNPEDFEVHKKSLQRFSAVMLHKAILRIRAAARTGQPLGEVAAEAAQIYSLRFKDPKSTYMVGA